MTYDAALRYLESFINYERLSDWPYKRSLKLSRFTGFLQEIHNPQDSLKVVHVAGSKGKGSTSAFIAYILREAGYSVGLYTSPHLCDFRERIRILKYGDGPKRDTLPLIKPTSAANSTTSDFEGMISKASLAAIVTKLKPAITKYNKRSSCGPLTFFEIYTAAAFTYFQQQKCDFVVLETGLGGRLDATNACQALVSVITPISLEHTDKLGTTIRAIANEKAGIIKRLGAPIRGKGVPFRTVPVFAVFVVSAPQHPEALRVISDRSRAAKAALYVVGKDILVSPKDPAAKRFSIKGITRVYENLTIKLPGMHQRENAATAVAAIEALTHQGVSVPATAISKGLQAARWPGRCELISRSPRVIVDGAQNEASAALLAHTIKTLYKFRHLILVIGASNDKDIPGMCRHLAPLAHLAIATRSQNPRAEDPAAIAAALAKVGAGKFSGTRNPPILTSTVTHALGQAIALASAQDLVLVTGSLFVVGEAREALCAH